MTQSRITKEEFVDKCKHDAPAGDVVSLFDLLKAQLEYLPEEARKSDYKTNLCCAVACTHAVIIFSVTGRNTWNEVYNFVIYRRHLIDEFGMSFIYPARAHLRSRGLKVQFKAFPDLSLTWRIRSRVWLMVTWALWTAEQIVEKWNAMFEGIEL